MDNQIGEYLKYLRKSKGMTLTQLEQISRVSNSYISQLENGHFKPSPDVLGKLSKALEVNFFDLMVKAGYMTIDSKKDSLDQEFLPKMIQSLSIEDKKEFISDFVNNSGSKFLHRNVVLEKKRKQKIQEIKKVGYSDELNDEIITDFLITNFHIFATSGDYLKLLRIYRGFTIEDMIQKMSIEKEDYIKAEKSEVKSSRIIKEWSEAIGVILEVGDFMRWYSEQHSSLLIEKEGIVEKVILLSKEISMKEDKNRRKWTFSIDYPMEEITSKSESDKDFLNWESAAKNFFSIENLLSLNHSLSLNNRVLSKHEKEKALQLLKLVFEKTETNSEEKE